MSLSQQRESIGIEIQSMINTLSAYLDYEFDQICIGKLNTAADVSCEFKSARIEHLRIDADIGCELHSKCIETSMYELPMKENEAHTLR